VYPVGTPATANQCGQFGDNQFVTMTFEDVLVALRAWAQLPGFRVPLSTDPFYAVDAFPPDNPPALGGGRGADPRRCVCDFTALGEPGLFAAHTAGGRLQTFQAEMAKRTAPGAHIPGPVTPGSVTSGAVILGAAEVRGSTMRVPVYLRAPRQLASLGISIGWAGPTTAELTFSNGEMGAPTALDTQVPGVVTAAWLQNVAAAAGQRVLVGYLECGLADGVTPDRLRVHHVETNGVDLTRVGMELFGEQLQ
jgi:hypothetical protein